MTEKTAAPQTDDVTPEELASLDEGRASIYNLLARMFRVEMDPMFLDELRAMRFPAQTGSDLMDAGYRRLASFLGKVGPATLTDLAIDYVRTFIGHGIDAHAAAYPYESVYTNPKRLMMSEARDQVLAIYHSEGIGKREDWHDPEDHMALELEFMATMATRTAAATRTGDDAEAERLTGVQRAFLADHLRVWVPTFARDMRHFSQSDLYYALADLLEGFVELDAEYLGE